MYSIQNEEFNQQKDYLPKINSLDENRLAVIIIINKK